ncbi:MAG: DUF4294 domain-containing protein [Candidatus Azobacteroides sp.]|nr:DUF4294 domain-containing protein [Candidatus Azobacteroides sp.]
MKTRLLSAILFGWFLSVCCLETKAQSISRQGIPDFASGQNDTLKVMTLNDIYVYPPQAFQNPAEEEKYRKLIRDVKKTLPYAKIIYSTLIETYEYIMTLPTKKEREAHLKRMEKDLYAEYMPVLKKMSLSQGKLLIKLVDRECNQSSYDLLKAFLGPFRAGFWNIFAGIFGASLKSTWDPNGKDAAAERIVELVEMGVL